MVWEINWKYVQCYHFWIVLPVAKHCEEHYRSGARISGSYPVDPDSQGAFDVFCDQTTAGGGWTVFQKRLDGSVDFYRNWADYKQGFGNLSGEFWLGLDKIHRLTSQANNTLRVELEDFDGNTTYAEYDTFAVADDTAKFRLSVGGYDAGKLVSPSVFLSWVTWDLMQVFERTRDISQHLVEVISERNPARDRDLQTQFEQFQLTTWIERVVTKQL